MKCKMMKQFGALGAAAILAANPCVAATLSASAIEPQPNAYGYYFVDQYKTNTMENQSPESNAVIGTLSSMLGIWKPGSTWNNGTFVDAAAKRIHQKNIETCITMTNNRTEEQGLNAYLTDRQNQNWSALDGLGVYESSFKQLTNAGTSLPDEIPADAQTKKYSDKGNANGNWADEDSALGSVVKLVNTVRQSSASGNPAKIYFQYMRPFRWSKEVNLLPALYPCPGDPETDGGFPSGHTNAGYLASLSLAYAVPERFQELLTNASEIGNYRIIAGMHSPLDVMAGRTMAMAIVSAALNDPDNAALKEQARKDAQNLLLTNPGTEEVSYYDNAALNKKRYTDRMTYNLPQTGDTTKPMTVPKGAEVLLETRFPYMDASERRWVLYSTGMPSGYAFLDDKEGWGRLNLYDAGAGYGAFDADVNVTMNAEDGGFSAKDTWSNDIDGEGSLTKNGTGTLVLSGNNSYTGGIHVNGGNLVAASAHAFGKSAVENNATLAEETVGQVILDGDYTQGAQAVLKLDIDSADDMLLIDGTAELNGTLVLDFSDYENPAVGMTVLSADALTGQFADIQVTGLSAGRSVAVSGNSIVVK